MYSLKKTIRTIGLVGAFAVVATTAQAVSPPPDGGYPNQNTAEGEDALFSLTTGLDNTAVGFEALFVNTGGSYNTANGAFALASNLSGSYNTAFGYQALGRNTSAQNTAVGSGALGKNTSGANNTAMGTGALGENLGWNSTAVGVVALWQNTTGGSNTAFGYGALSNNTTGGNNTAVGNNAGSSITTGSNNIDIGNIGANADVNRIRIGTRGTHQTAFVAGISGVTVANGVGVVVNSQGQLGTITSSARFKDQIKPMNRTSESIFSLQPVTFHYKKEFDSNTIPQFGLVAEQVEEVNPDLVARDEAGKPYTVRYEAVNAMLLNEFIKAHQKIESLTRKNEKQESTNKDLKSAIVEQQKEIQALTEALKAQAVQIQKVSEQVEAGKPAPRLVAGSQ